MIQAARQRQDDEPAPGVEAVNAVLLSILRAALGFHGNGGLQVLWLRGLHAERASPTRNNRCTAGIEESPPKGG
jgi:hypothetical protein